VSPGASKPLAPRTPRKPRREHLGALQLGILYGLSVEGPYIGQSAGPNPVVRAALLTMPAWGTHYTPDWSNLRNIKAALYRMVERGFVASKPVTTKGSRRLRLKYTLTQKGRDELADRRQRWEDRAGIKRTGMLRWEKVPDSVTPAERIRWFAPELLDMGWKAVLEYSAQWGWRFKLTRPDGKESGWIYCAKQDLEAAKQEAQATLRSVMYTRFAGGE